uniref:Glutathione transferase n=1 Tax=Paramoeba aestuarina TaxID=180227 RepID=A0A7S4PD74_9EUKA|mmetsp:Transcript_4136/g.6253  ORF Transcript_4136/g.6253 Transcript_4136/m.6253 type:complete len:227 (+) Transcript_4136:92-772(+)
MSSKVVIHGHWVSQPCRSVLWAMMNEGVAFDFKKWDPMSGETRSPEFLAMNPAGTIPVMEDNGLFLFESPAIMTYLAQKHHWNKLYPTDLAQRSQVDQYLHWHHGNTRLCSGALFRPVLVGVLTGKSKEEVEAAVAQGQKKVAKVSKVVDQFLAKNNGYIAADHLTIADYMCYCEYDQLEVLNLFEFSKYPHLQKWMGTMKTLPNYEESHKTLMKLASMIQSKSKL